MTEKELAIELLKSMLAGGEGATTDAAKQAIRLAEIFEREWRMKNR